MARWWWVMMVGGAAFAAPATPEVRALELPMRANALRAVGVEAAEVAETLVAAKAHGLAPEEAGAVLDEATESTKANGKIDNLGGYVTAKLDEGLRGRELAAAIHAEHAARGIGKPEGTPGRGKAGDNDPPGRSGEDHGKPDEPGEGKGGKGKGKSGKGAE